MRSIPALTTLLACSTAAQTPPPTTPTPKAPPEFGTLTGRVMLDGRPVTSFGVIVTRHANSSVVPEPEIVSAPDGRFSLTRIKPGQHDIIVVGDSFARHLIPRVSIRRGEMLDLGDVTVQAGYVVKGVVVDDAGRGVPNAKVQIRQSDSDGYGELRDKALGNHVTWTNRNGHFEVRGVTTHEPTRPVWRTVAVVPGGASLPAWLAAGNHSVRLVVLPTGTVNGHVDGLDGLVAARLVTRPIPSTFAAIAEDGSYSLELPIGEYELTVVRGRTSYKRMRVKVKAAVTTQIDFLRP